MRRTLTIDDDLDALLERENKKTHEPMKQTINRVLRAGLGVKARTSKLKRFVVQPLDTGVTRKDWERWDGMKIEEILDEAERGAAR